MFVYKQSTGELFHDDDDTLARVLIGKGYSGALNYKNRGGFEVLPDKGPIPRGRWGILGPPVDTSTHGPYVLHLFPMVGTDTYGRSGFLIHGDSVRAPGTASKGCIIMSHDVREQIWASGDTLLEVVS